MLPKKGNKIRIVALTKASGSKYHRVDMPLSLLVHTFPDKYELLTYDERHFTEESVKDADIVYSHWTYLTRCEMMSIWKDKYGFKIIQDADDYWVLPDGHPSQEVIKKMVPQLLNQFILADMILCSTEQLKEKLLYYNPNVVIRENFLPANSPIAEFSQFQIENRDFYKDERLNIGICGSVSHLPDWLGILKSIKSLSSDKYIQKYVRFVVSGYSDNNEITKKTWNRIVNVFTYSIPAGKQFITIRPKVVRFSLPTNYMQNYKDIDILLCPLEINDFNKCKSNLKILEAGLLGIIPIGTNNMYEDKISSDCYIESSNLAYTLKNLVKLWKENPNGFNKKAKELQHNILNHNFNFYHDNINKLDEIFTALCN